jgi:hypothetical protein
VSNQQTTDTVSPAEEYRLLSGLLAQQHTRYNDFCHMCLTGNTLLFGFAGLIIKGSGPVPHGLILLLACAGIGICVVWVLTLTRLRRDVKRILWQLRDREATMGLEGGIFRQGFRHMYGYQSLESVKLPQAEGRILEFPKCCLPARFPAHWAGNAFAFIFIGAYILILCFAGL